MEAPRGLKSAWPSAGGRRHRDCHRGGSISRRPEPFHAVRPGRLAGIRDRRGAVPQFRAAARLMDGRRSHAALGPRLGAPLRRTQEKRRPTPSTISSRRGPQIGPSDCGDGASVPLPKLTGDIAPLVQMLANEITFKPAQLEKSKLAAMLRGRLSFHCGKLLHRCADLSHLLRQAPIPL